MPQPEIVKPTMPPWAQTMLDTAFSFVPQRYKRIVGGAGVLGVLIAQHLGYISGDMAFWLGAAFGSYGFAGLMHADVKTDKNVEALADELLKVKAEMQQITK